MSYCRFSNDSDIYLFCNTAGYYECCACKLAKREWDSFTCKTRKAIINHLDKHLKAGHKVPPRSFARLFKEQKLENPSFIFDTVDVLERDIEILEDMLNNDIWDKDDRKYFREQIKELKSVLEFLKQYTKLGGHNV